jgi:hypothetical protein
VSVRSWPIREAQVARLSVSFEESNGQSRFNYLLTGINKQRLFVELR